jgi:hypothetical protein
LAHLPGRGGEPAPSGRKAALLGVAAATAFGFVAAVIKELSAHLSQGPAAVFSNWSPYVLLVSGAIAFFLVSNAFQAGSLAASQPGLTVVDPLVASLLGVLLFGERLDHHPLALAGEALAGGAGGQRGGPQCEPDRPRRTGDADAQPLRRRTVGPPLNTPASRRRSRSRGPQR